MTHEERLDFLLKELLEESSLSREVSFPSNLTEKKDLLRALMNSRMPSNTLSDRFFDVQNEYLRKENYDRGITHLSDLIPTEKDIYLWKGDITTLDVDAIVNAANSKLLGCFIPGHHCIDNAIHTFSGIQLRLFCNEIMTAQGYDEPIGKAKITPAYNLPCKYILHTVGPVVYGELTERDCALLESCYSSCLKKASEYNLESIAFCCISTGEFHFPNEAAANIAVNAVRKFKKHNSPTNLKIIFNVFKELDFNIYKNLLNS